MKPGKLKVYIKLFRSNKYFEVEYIYKKKHEDRAMVLDVLLQAQQESLDIYHLGMDVGQEIAGLCTIDINGENQD